MENGEPLIKGDIMKKTEKVLHVLRTLEDICIVVPMGVIVVLVLMNVFLRYILGTGFLWSDEIIGFAFVLVGMIGSAIAVREDNHTYLDSFVLKLKQPVQKIFYLFNQIMIAFMLVFFTISGILFAFSVGEQVSSMNHIPMYIPYSFIPIGTGLMLAEQIILFVQRAKCGVMYWEPKQYDE